MSIGPERLPLSKEQVVIAEQRIGVSHPIVAVLEAYTPRIAEINQGFNGIKRSSDQQRYIAENFGFLADSVQQIGDFPVGALDLIIIWSKAKEIFENDYESYGLARIVATCYAVYGTSHPAWNSFPRQWVETHTLSAELAEDKENLLHAKTRLSDIGDSLNDLDFYSSGVRGRSASSIAIELAKRMRDGDKKAERELDEFSAYNKEHSSPLTNKIVENFRTILYSINQNVEDELSQPK